MKIRLLLTAAAIVFVGMLTVAPASAQYVGGTPPKAGPVAGPSAVAPAKAKPIDVKVQGAQPRRVTRFAVTGADIAQMVIIGGVLVGGGAILVRHGRRRVVPSGS
jgi:hypothetical protein